MEYWWVNHKQTFDQELNFGYLWSPKTNKNGSRNQFYVNMTIIREGDIVFSYSDGVIKAIGFITARGTESTRPDEFGDIGEQWNREGWIVRVDWQLLENPFSPKEYIERIRNLLPSKYSPIRTNGDGNQGCYLASISDNLAEELLSISVNKESVQNFVEEKKIEKKENDEIDRIRTSNLPTTEKKQLITARRGQGVFRENLKNVESECRLTHVNNEKLLIASHIKPWRDSTDTEKLDGNNGLLLSPHIDKLFDSGYITFTNDGHIHRASEQVDLVMEKWGLDPKMNIGKFTSDQERYLEYHRKHIFTGN
ncbi:MAG: HNH endonuclease [Candidatus Lokiarchaeota archaeon]|nr:HNH endonuclease [Candidatus Lokiarchaeota archaeon]